jgi:hypothetical protein
MVHITRVRQTGSGVDGGAGVILRAHACKGLVGMLGPPASCRRACPGGKDLIFTRPAWPAFLDGAP